MATKIFVHGSGHKATSWEKTISYMTNNEDIVCPNLSSILEGKEASYENLYSSFVKYCNEFDGQIHLCGLSLGGILALNFALDFPQKVKTLVLIGTPYKVPKNIKCPTLILCGKKDSANMESADYLSQNIRSAELKIIENTGHVVNEENPKALADILNEYYLKNS